MGKKARKLEEQVLQMLADMPKATEPVVHIRDNQFKAVEFNGDALKVIEAIAKGLDTTAHGLGHLASVLHASNIRVEAMIKLNPIASQTKGEKDG